MNYFNFSRAGEKEVAVTQTGGTNKNFNKILTATHGPACTEAFVLTGKLFFYRLPPGFMRKSRSSIETGWEFFSSVVQACRSWLRQLLGEWEKPQLLPQSYSSISKSLNYWRRGKLLFQGRDENKTHLLLGKGYKASCPSWTQAKIRCFGWKNRSENPLPWGETQETVLGWRLKHKSTVLGERAENSGHPKPTTQIRQSLAVMGSRGRNTEKAPLLRLRSTGQA